MRPEIGQQEQKLVTSTGQAYIQVTGGKSVLHAVVKIFQRAGTKNLTNHKAPGDRGFFYLMLKLTP